MRQVKEGIKDEMKEITRSEETDLNKVKDCKVSNKQ
jgi:hypothetical protein